MKIVNCKLRIENRRGFSFMEVMMVVAIIGILSSVSLVSLSNSREKKDVETAAREVVAAIRETQNYALTGKQPVATDFPCFYRFSPTQNSETYTINYNYHISGTNCVTPAPIDSSLAYGSYALKNRVTFSVVSNISFSVPFAVTSGGRIVITKGSNNYTICVNSAGKISELSGTVCP